jgi:carbamoyltransferase
VGENRIVITTKNEIHKMKMSKIKLLLNGLAIGWFQGRAEFGPRALGNRSILANPIDPEMQMKLNLKIKFRESFRPFAPIMTIKTFERFFNRPYDKYMLLVRWFKDTERISSNKHNSSLMDRLYENRTCVPSITHVDYSARAQVIEESDNKKLWLLLKKFGELNNHKVEMLVNTSFNIRGEPIVESPSDAIKCFFGTDLDVLVLDNYVLTKIENQNIKIDYKDNFFLD